MIFKKHWKLLRKFWGNIVYRQNIRKALYLIILWPVEILGDVLYFWKHRDGLALSHPERMLIIKADQLGDVLFSTFLLPLIKKQHPAIEIDYVVNPKARGVLEKNPHIANIYDWEDAVLNFLPGRGAGSSFSQMAKRNAQTMKILKGRKYSAVINTRAYPPSSNMPWREIGVPLIAFDISEQSFLADYWADYDLEQEEWKNYLNLLRPFGIDPATADFHEGFYNLGANPMAGKGSYAVISPVTFDRDRRWGSEQWKNLITAIRAKGCAVAITGTRDQEKYIDSILPEAQESIFVFTALSLPEFASLMSGAAFFAGIDSFPAHLALAFNKRSAFFLNSSIYYLYGLTPKRFAIDGRCMLPVLENTKFFDVKIAVSRDVEQAYGFDK